MVSLRMKVHARHRPGRYPVGDSPGLVPFRLPLAGRPAQVFGATLLYALICWASAGRFSPSHYFNEGGPIDWLSSVFLATAAVLAWCTWCVRRPEREKGSWFWLASASGLAFLALDERFMFHERFHYRFGHLLGPPPAGLRNWNDVVVIVYGLMALILVVPAWSTLLRYRRHLKVLLLAFGFYVVHTTVDSVFVHSPGKTLIEETFKILAGAGFMLAYLQALMARLEAGVSSSRPVPGAGSSHQGESSPSTPTGRWPLPGLGRGPVVTFALLMVLLMVPMLLVHGSWRQELTAHWGDPLLWLASVCLGVAALLAWMVWPPMRHQMRRPHLVWLASAALMGFLAWNAATLACRISFARSPLAGLLLGRPGVRLAPGHLPAMLPFVILLSAALLMAVISLRVYGAGAISERLFAVAVLTTFLLGLLGFLVHDAPPQSRMAMVGPLLLVLAAGTCLLAFLEALMVRTMIHLEQVAACRSRVSGPLVLAAWHHLPVVLDGPEEERQRIIEPVSGAWTRQEAATLAPGAELWETKVSAFQEIPPSAAAEPSAPDESPRV